MPNNAPTQLDKAGTLGALAAPADTSASDAVDGSSTGTEVPLSGRRWGDHDSKEGSMHGVTTIGLDIAKSVFQVHGIDAIGKVVIRRQLMARRPTKVAAIALANKIARMAWAMMAKSERYKEPAALAA